MRSHARSRRGSALIEFALVLGVLLMILAGAFRYGYPIFVYHQLESSVAAAGRYAARSTFDVTGVTFAAQVKNMAVYGSPDGAGTPLARGLTTANVQVAWTRDAANVPVTITISVVNYSLTALYQTFQFSGKPRVTVRYSGKYQS